MSEVKQSINQLQVVGTLSEMNLKLETKEHEFRKDGKVVKKEVCKVISKKEFKNPSMTIEVDRPDGSVSVIGVSFNGGFDVAEKMLDKDGKLVENKRFKALETMLKYTPKSSAKEDSPATRVKIDCSLRANEYVGSQDNEFKSFPDISAFQCTSSNVPEEDIAEGKISVIIRSIIQETRGENAEETGRLLVEAYSFDYQGHAVPHKFIVEEDLADDFKDYYKNGDSCKLFYEVIAKQVGAKQETKSSGFGRREEKMVSGFTVMEYSIFKGDEAFEEENEYFIPLADMKTAMDAREIMIENMKKVSKEKSKGGEKKETKGKGLGSRPTKAEFNEAVEEDGELPF